ncbi:MAG: fluoride efflux transporter CrcB [Thiotrichaceae bacterium]|nr:fluoride efflux transporter CrcB [Thiotrichaceae bacterium]
MLQLASIMLGGALGAISRFALSNLVSTTLGRDFPYGTLTVNLIGSFLIGLLTIFFAQKSGLDPSIRLGVLVGFLGALTTFSTFSLETLSLLEQGSLVAALSNIFISIISCIAMVWLGMQLAKQVLN